jgi:hypothetical protein
MWVPATRKEWLVGALAALLGVLGLTSLGYHTGKEDGIKHGIDMYHDMCYTIGGFVVNEAGQVVACTGLTQVPKEELPLDRNKKV